MNVDNAFLLLRILCAMWGLIRALGKMYFTQMIDVLDVGVRVVFILNIQNIFSFIS